MTWNGHYDADIKRSGRADIHACFCVGPQNGEPLCPCGMRGLVQRDGRWGKPEKDFGPVNTPDKEPKEHQSAPALAQSPGRKLDRDRAER